jgi:tetratricopeptide (TPR) repeat protein
MLRWIAMLFAAAAVCAQTGAPATAEGWLEQGKRQFAAKQLDEATQSFEQVLQLDPRNSEARVGLADVSLQRWLKARDAEERLRFYFQARNLLVGVLEQEPDNKKALRGIARLSYLGRSSAPGQDKDAWLDEARRWNLRLVEVDPQEPSGHFALGVLAWTKCVSPDGNSRGKAGMTGAEDGPIPDATVRSEYREACRPTVEEGTAQLEQAVALRPDEATYLRYLAQLLRMRADYADTPEAARPDLELARQMEAKAQKAVSSQPSAVSHSGSADR